jgi:hypothetical protein
MPLTDDDWSDVFEHTRRQLRELGMADVDQDVTTDFRPSHAPSSDFLRYLSRVTAAVRERSLSGYRRALDTVRENIKTNRGGQVDGIDVVFTEEDARVVGLKGGTIDLGKVGDYDLLINELESLRAYLHKNGVTE